MNTLRAVPIWHTTIQQPRVLTMNLDDFFQIPKKQIRQRHAQIREYEISRQDLMFDQGKFEQLLQDFEIPQMSLLGEHKF